ncbi:MAG: hypothetical protein PHD58_10485, partial [Anaerolineales bacterium]|nr:hypothetical protein [Anaerolineales bacterium]
PVSATYASRFLLIGSMNPEEGQLRPQIQDRFGLRVIVKGLVDESDRLEAYKRVQAHQSNPRGVIQQFQLETEMARQEIQAARQLLPEVSLPDEVTHLGLELIDKLKIDSLRAEITLFEAARAFAAADGRSTAQMDDLRQAAPLALRLRRSQFMSEYFSNQQAEDAEISAFVNNILAPGSQTNV